MFGKIGPGELILVLAIALIIFGPTKLPEIGKSFGEAINNFKSSANKTMQICSFFFTMLLTINVC